MSARRTPVPTIAFLAVAQHAADHALPFHGIDTPITPGGPFVVKVAADDMEAWLDTLTDLSPGVTKPVGDGPAAVLRHRGVVPGAIGGVPVEVLCILRRPAPQAAGLRLLVGSAS
ncbi:hypothetical protein [Nocardioides soli]|uniref:Uncharacterized protein n=1 Tax=Nocardioides soli TaxID=1036020 RepID=A0A7W4Z0V5_9ACTN|nr:hypothetical protein [Nocardioides soli]MBB3041176.1 hypothetical protein [Nocardioides soli]